jgi:ADP-heptose:LPS heptosyltransferase
LTIPLLAALRGLRPDLELDVLVEASFAPVFARHPHVSHTLVLRDRTGPGWSRGRALAELVRRRYPAVLNLHGGTTSLLLTLATRARLRIGQATFRHAGAYTVRVPPSSAVWGRPVLHTVEHQLTPLRWAGIPIPPEQPIGLPLAPGAVERADSRLRAHGIAPGSFILVQPTATLATKQWPEERFAALGARLVERYRAPVVFTAARREQATLERVAAHGSGPNRLFWSDLDVEELFALIARCRIFVGNDSGPMHAAAALGRPIVAVWGSSSHAAWRPWGSDHETVRSDLPCMPCPGYRCAAFGEPRCILDLDVGRVLAACERMLERQGRTA